MITGPLRTARAPARPRDAEPCEKDREEEPNVRGLRTNEQTSAQIRPRERADDHHRSELRIDETLGVVDERARGRRNHDHEVARRDRGFHRHAHQDVHRRHFDESAADTEQTREHARGSTHTESGAGALDSVPIDALILLVEVHTAQVEAFDERPFFVSAPIRAIFRGLRDPHHRRRGIEDDHAEREEEIDIRDEDPDHGAGDRTESCRDLEEHRKTQVREMIPHIHGCGAGGRRDHPNQARRNRDLDVNLERQRHERNEEDAASDSQIGTREARQERRDGQQQQDLDHRHAGRLDTRPINFFPRLLRFDKKSAQGIAKIAFGLRRTARISRPSSSATRRGRTP